MIGFVLAAGLGTRLRPLTDHIPKALVPVCGIPLLRRSLDALMSCGCSPLGVNAHHQARQIYAFRSASNIPLEVFHEQGTIRGTGGALDFAREFLGSADSFCVMNADILSNVNLQRCAASFLGSGRICALVAAPAAGKGTVLYDPGRKEFCGLPAEQPSFPESVPADFIGITFYRREALQFVLADDFSVIPVWRRMRDSGIPPGVLIESGIFWYDSGNPLSLAGIHFDFLDGKIGIPVPEGMIIDYGRKIAYPASLDKKSATVLSDHVWTDSGDIDESAMVTRSIVFPGTRVPGGARICDQIYTGWGGIAIQ
jgi:NDP-sugar pyrophosphorylase family protein